MAARSLSAALLLLCLFSLSLTQATTTQSHDIEDLTDKTLKLISDLQKSLDVPQEQIAQAKSETEALGVFKDAVEDKKGKDAEDSKESIKELKENIQKIKEEMKDDKKEGKKGDDEKEGKKRHLRTGKKDEKEEDEDEDLDSSQVLKALDKADKDFFKHEEDEEEDSDKKKEKKQKKKFKYVPGLSEPVEEEDDGSRDILKPAPDAPIDIVYTWVNGSDKTWLALHNAFLAGVKEDIDEGTRLFSDNGELRYSIRSIAHYGKGLNFRHIFIITEQQSPSWLNVSNPRIRVVTHADMMDPEDVPSFSTFAIEANLDRIPGLSEHFVYFNDDFFVGRPINADSFFDGDGKQKVFMSRKWVHTRPCERTHPWRCALRYTAELFDQKYGKRKRFVSAHAPLLMSRTVMRRMRAAFREEFKKTSGHRFRGLGNSLTLYFMYAEYLLAEKYPAKQVVGTCRDTYQYVDMFEDSNGNLRDLTNPKTQEEIWNALTKVGDSQFFVINKADGNNKLIQRFMAMRFPIASAFEDPSIPNYIAAPAEEKEEEEKEKHK